MYVDLVHDLVCKFCFCFFFFFFFLQFVFFIISWIIISWIILLNILNHYLFPNYKIATQSLLPYNTNLPNFHSFFFFQNSSLSPPFIFLHISSHPRHSWQQFQNFVQTFFVRPRSCIHHTSLFRNFVNAINVPFSRLLNKDSIAR